MVYAVEAKKNVGIKVNWVDRVIGRILKAKDHPKLAQMVSSIRDHMEDI